MRLSLADTGPHRDLRLQQLSSCCQLLSQLRARGKSCHFSAFQSMNMSGQVHAVMKPSQDIDATILSLPEHHKVTPLFAQAGHMQCSDIWRDLVARLGTRKQRAVMQSLDGQSQCLGVNFRLSLSEILNGPSQDLHKIQLSLSGKPYGPSHVQADAVTLWARDLRWFRSDAWVS